MLQSIVTLGSYNISIYHFVVTCIGGNQKVHVVFQARNVTEAAETWRRWLSKSVQTIQSRNLWQRFHNNFPVTFSETETHVHLEKLYKTGAAWLSKALSSVQSSFIIRSCGLLDQIKFQSDKKPLFLCTTDAAYITRPECSLDAYICTQTARAGRGSKAQLVFTGMNKDALYCL